MTFDPTATLESFVLVLVGEMGDKTQLLALILASRFRKPWTIMLGILCATILNHALASWAGGWLSSHLNPTYLKWTLVMIFLIFAAWILVPDKEEELKETGHHGAFFTTLVVFFLAEMGDKTQLATVALGAKFASTLSVTLGTTAGMLIADGMAVFMGEKLLKKVSMNWIRIVASGLFLLFAIGIAVGM